MDRCGPQSYLFAFADWRQVPALTDAVQVAGWTWRGVNVWDKGDGARMAHQGYFRAQAEYVVWGTNGALDAKYEKGGDAHVGVFRHSVDSEKEHLTQKPVEVMRWLLAISAQGANVGEPFSGSGTTLIACEQSGRTCYAMELMPEYVAVALERMKQAFPKLEITRDDGAG